MAPVGLPRDADAAREELLELACSALCCCFIGLLSFVIRRVRVLPPSQPRGSREGLPCCPTATKN